MKELWENLLLNSTDSGFHKEMKNIFIHIIANLSSSSTQLVEKLITYYAETHFPKLQGVS